MTMWLCLVKSFENCKHVVGPVLYIYYATSVRSFCGRSKSADQTTYTHTKTIRWKLKIYQPFECACTAYAQVRLVKFARIKISAIYGFAAFSIIWPLLDLLQLPESDQLFFNISFTLWTHVPIKMKDIKRVIAMSFYNELNDHTEKLQKRSSYRFYFRAWI